MTVSSFNPTQAISLSEVAKQYFVKKMQNQTDKLIRLTTKVSGCTGFAYVLDLADGPEDEDTVFTFDELTIAVSEEALSLVSGTEIDVAQEGLNEVVKFNNPNVVSECGCGESFSVTDQGVV
ncbi:ATPase [Marinomonas sp. 42_23_T18]|nr:ATPase [Marinomonas sp. 42_23_T18]